jgi:hypothetical protein
MPLVFVHIFDPVILCSRFSMFGNG